MKKICDKRCIIGEGPIWNVREEKLYFTNGYGNEICCLDIETGELLVRPVTVGCAAFAFDREGRMYRAAKQNIWGCRASVHVTPIAAKMLLNKTV